MRLKQLDALRGLAVILVLGHHVTWNPLWVRFGWSGVDLFFVLSGFLISGLLFREYKQYGNIHILRFWTRRALKIYPAYYLLIFATVAGRMLAKTPIGWSHIWPDLIFVQSYVPGTWGHLWSLAVEEHFYILLPLLLWAMTMRRRRTHDPFHQLPLVCLITAVACLALRSAHLLTGEPFNFQSHKFATHVRLDALSFGVLFSYYWEFRHRSIERLFKRRRTVCADHQPVSTCSRHAVRANDRLHAHCRTFAVIRGIRRSPAVLLAMRGCKAWWCADWRGSECTLTRSIFATCQLPPGAWAILRRGHRPKLPSSEITDGFSFSLTLG